MKKALITGITGQDELYLPETIKKNVGYKVEIKFNLRKPDGTSRKFLDSQRINNLDFKVDISLK